MKNYVFPVRIFRLHRCVQLNIMKIPLLPLARLYNLERELDQALQEKIWLNSGGFLIIQQTEAFVAIDVNTGKHSSKKRCRRKIIN